MLLLNRSWGDVSAAHRGSLHWQWIVADPIGAAIESDVPLVRDCVAAHDRLVHICGVNDGCIHAHHRGVVRKLSSAPFAAHKADSHVSVTIVDAAIVADSIAPVAIMEPVAPVFPAPPRRGPESADVGSGDPLTRNPVVAIITIGPVTRRPQPTLLRAWRLFIDRQNWGSDGDRNRYAREGRRGNNKYD